jgi:hypothetical protein
MSPGDVVRLTDGGFDKGFQFRKTDIFPGCGEEEVGPEEAMGALGKCAVQAPVKLK